MNELELAIAKPADAGALAAVYAPYVRNTPVTFEVDMPSAEEFTARMAAILPEYPYIVARLGGRVAGFAYAARHRSRAAYRWNAELSVYVTREAQGRGVGGALYGALLDLLRRMNLINAYVCITVPDDQSVGFHEKLGFTPVGRFPRTGFKAGAWHDVLWMEKSLGVHDCPPREPVPFGKLDRTAVEEILATHSIFPEI